MRVFLHANERKTNNNKKFTGKRKKISNKYISFFCLLVFLVGNVTVFLPPPPPPLSPNPLLSGSYENLTTRSCDETSVSRLNFGQSVCRVDRFRNARLSDESLVCVSLTHLTFARKFFWHNIWFSLLISVHMSALNGLKRLARLRSEYQEKALLLDVEISRRVLRHISYNVKLKDRICNTTIRQRTRVTDITWPIWNGNGLDTWPKWKIIDGLLDAQSGRHRV